MNQRRNLRLKDKDRSERNVRAVSRKGSTTLLSAGLPRKMEAEASVKAKD